MRSAFSASLAHHRSHGCHLLFGNRIITIFVEFAESLPCLLRHFVFGNFAIAVFVSPLEHFAGAAFRSFAFAFAFPFAAFRFFTGFAFRFLAGFFLRPAFPFSSARSHQFLHCNRAVAVRIKLAESLPSLSRFFFGDGLVSVGVYFFEKRAITFTALGASLFFSMNKTEAANDQRAGCE